MRALTEVVTNATKLLEQDEDRLGRLLEARSIAEVRAIMATRQYVKR